MQPKKALTFDNMLMWLYLVSMENNMEKKEENGSSQLFVGPTEKNYCVKCGKKLNKYEKDNLGGICSDCDHEWVRVEKE